MKRRDAYATPAAFRRALTDKLKETSRTSQWPLAHLQRQMAYDRLLERLYHVDNRWIVKGATALLARKIGVRGTIDIDVYREAPYQLAEVELRAAAATDISDWFRFELGRSQAMRDADRGARIPVTAYVGSAIWAEFHVDLVGSGIRMTGAPEDVPPLAQVMMPNVEQRGYRAYPLVDHIADKVAAMFEGHGRANAPSIRYKDLVDLVAIVSQTSVRAADQPAALTSEVRRRGIALPARFTVPDRDLWESGYAAEARRSLLPYGRTLDEALAIVSPFIDPLLNGTAGGIWDFESRRWST
jgi:hypothetical protein